MDCQCAEPAAMASAMGWRDKRDAEDSEAAYEKREKRRNIRKLQEAIDKKDTRAVEEILQKDFDVDFRYRGQTALQLAVNLGALDICKLLIDRGANVDEADGELNSLLNSACWNGHGDVAKLLIQRGANLDFENEACSTPLHACAKKGRTEILRLLVAGNCSLNNPDRQGCTALFVATQSANYEVVAELIKAGANLDWADVHKRTPLMMAADQGLVDIACALIAAGANCDLQDSRGQTALLLAAIADHVQIVKSLLQHHANPDIPAHKGNTPLLEAVRNYNLDMAQLLLEAGCDINLVDRLHNAPIHEAIRQVAQYFDPSESSGAVSLVKRLVKSGADLNVGDNLGWRPIYQAAYGRNFELSELLLQNGADLNVITKNGDTVMHGAVYGNDLDIVKLLINAGCSVNGANSDQQNPLTAAIISRADMKILSALVDAGTDLNLSERSAGHTPLHEAVHRHYNEAAILLIDAGCDLTAQNNDHQTALCLASQKGNDVIVSYLLDKLPRPLVFTKLAAIPIHTAAKHGHAHIVQLLVERGCDINQLNIDGLTPLQVATTEDNFSAAQRLLQLGCDPDAHAKVTKLQKCCLVNEDAHPHFALEPLFNALSHRNMDLMRILLCCYHETPYRVVKLLKTVLKSSRELAAHYDMSMKQELVSIFNSLSQPKSLQDICRSRIRVCVGFPVEVKVCTLPLAEKQKEYVCMHDVFDSLDDDNQLEEEMRFKPEAFGGGGWRGNVQ